MTEKINLIVDESPKKNWFSCVEYFEKKSSENLFDKNDISYILKNLKEALKDKRINQSINWMMLGVIFSPDIFLHRIRKDGILRPSRYNFDSYLMLKMIDKISCKLKLTENMMEYFASLRNLYLLSSEVRALKLDIIRNLRIGKETVLRKLLQNLDYVFMLEAMKKRPLSEKSVDRDNIADAIIFFSAEELAEAMGYVFHLYYDCIRYPQHFDNVTLDISGIDLGKILINAAKIRAFYESEIFVDSYKFNLSSELGDEKKMSLNAPNENFSKSLSLGYIHYKSQELSRFSHSAFKETISLEDVAKDLAKTFGKNFMTLKEKPIKRYVFEFPCIGSVSNFFSSSSLFAEEVTVLEFYANEWSLSLDDLLDFQISEKLKIWDLIKIHRVINFYRWIIVSSLELVIEDEEETVINSLSPIFSKQQLKDIFDDALGKKSDDIVDFLSYDFKKGGVFDLQYQPIISIKNGYVIPFNILANSSILRNSIQLSKKRFFEDGTFDPLTDLMFNAFSKKTEKVKKNYKYVWNGKHGEIDVISIIDNILFVLECKNSTLPCSPHEMRTSYDYILKASSQLERFEGLYNLSSFKEMISKKLGCDLKGVPLVSGIIMSNRMFSGYRINNYSVRGSLEFVNFMETGNISIGSEKKCFWKNSCFTGKDLYNYMERNITFIPLWDAMISIDSYYPIGKYNLLKRDYALDIRVLAKNLGFNKVVKIIDDRIK